MRFSSKFQVFIGSIFTISIVSLSILQSEKAKKQEKYFEEMKLYESQLRNWNEYKKSYDEQIQALIEKNNAGMAATKKQYEDLLARQPELIKQHSVVTVQNVAPSSQSVSVVKPSSKPKTSSS